MFSNLTQHFNKKKPAAAMPYVEPEAWQPEAGFDIAEEAPEQRVVPQLKPHFEQPRRDLAGFFSGLREAAERYAMIHIAPLAALSSTVRFQLRTVAVYVKPENDKLLHELQALPPHIIKAAAVNCLKQSRVADQFDLSEFFGIIIVAGEEVAAGEAVMTLATVGIERINIEFEFEGEHVAGKDVVEPMEDCAPEVDIAFRLVYRDGRTEPLDVKGFPLLIGKSAAAAIHISGTHVSREHATLYFDTSLHRVVLQDHSRHGTWLNGKRLEGDGRAILHGSGQIHLASTMDLDAPAIEFSHAAIEQMQPTPLTPLAEVVTPVAVEPEPPLASNDCTPVTPPLAAIWPAPAMPLETMLAPVAEAATPLAMGAQETLLCDPQSGRALAWLQVRTVDGVSTLPVTELPFVIGREPKGAGFSVDGQASYVSREHLKLLSFHHKCFTIENGGLGRNNTYRKGVLQDNRFLYQPVSPVSDAGWIVLGGQGLDEKCVEVRLVTAFPGVAP